MLRTFKSRVVRRTFWLIKMVPTWKKFGKRCFKVLTSHIHFTYAVINLSTYLSHCNCTHILCISVGMNGLLTMWWLIKGFCTKLFFCKWYFWRIVLFHFLDICVSVCMWDVFIARFKLYHGSFVMCMYCLNIIFVAVCACFCELL